LTSLPQHKPIHIHSFIYYTSLMLLNFHSLVVESSLRRDADQRKLEKKLKKAESEGQKKLRELSNIEFACDTDAWSGASR
jgi:Skp family chaperone for outer membrane proteins